MAYDELLKRFEAFICDEFVGKTVDFEEYKKHLQKRFLKLKKHMLLSNQKTFVLRLDSPLDDEKAWLNSLAQAIMGKTLARFSDEDEMLLYEKFKSMIMQLDSLTKVSKSDIEILGIPLPFPTHNSNTRAGSGYSLQSFCPTHKAKRAKRIFASIPNAA
jgi:hypothetical protein